MKTLMIILMLISANAEAVYCQSKRQPEIIKKLPWCPPGYVEIRFAGMEK